MAKKDEIVLILEGGGPSSLPLARLAAYMAEFATMLGESEEIFFSEVREKCTAIAATPKRGGSLTSAKNRAYGLAQNAGPADAQRAFEHIAKMAREDSRPARVVDGHSVILHFPRRERAAETHLRVRDSGQVTGELSGMLRVKGAIKARIRPIGGGPYVECTADEGVARKMRGHLLEMVRVTGAGWFRRSSEGWICESLDVRDIEPVKVTDLRTAVQELREDMDVDWPDDPIGEIAALG